jgi:CheY-like chemotaxis protein
MPSERNGRGHCEKDHAPNIVGTAGPGPRVLLVDDNPEVLELFTYFLSAVGFRVAPAKSAYDALRIASAGFDVVATDLAMPGMDGFELIRRLRALQPTARIPILAVTGLSLDTSLNSRQSLGSCKVLLKPCEPERLAAMLRLLVDTCVRDCDRCRNAGHGRSACVPEQLQVAPRARRYHIDHAGE